MGWTFKNLCEVDDTDLYLPLDTSELTHTAFGKAVEIPSDFVSPVNATYTKANQNSRTRIHRKRATGPGLSSSTKTCPTDRRSSNTATTRQQPPKKKIPKGSTNADKTDSRATAEPVDFVYDIHVRRKLREQLDEERRRLLRETAAKEAKLRAQSKWVFDKNKSPPARKQAWSADSATGSSSSKRAPRPRAASAFSRRAKPAEERQSNDVEASIRAFEQRLYSIHLG